MTTTPSADKVHHGRNIKRLREMLGIKQEALALSLGEEWSQHKVSRLEDKEVIEDDILKEIGKALHVSPEAIKNFDEQAAVNIISTTFNSHDNSTSVAYQSTFNFNPIDKIVELYERMLQLEKEKLELFERLLKERK